MTRAALVKEIREKLRQVLDQAQKLEKTNLRLAIEYIEEELAKSTRMLTFAQSFIVSNEIGEYQRELLFYIWTNKMIARDYFGIPFELAAINKKLKSRGHRLLETSKEVWKTLEDIDNIGTSFEITQEAFARGMGLTERGLVKQRDSGGKRIETNRGWKRIDFPKMTKKNRTPFYKKDDIKNYLIAIGYFEK